MHKQELSVGKEVHIVSLRGHLSGRIGRIESLNPNGTYRVALPERTRIVIKAPRHKVTVTDKAETVNFREKSFR